MVALKIRIAAQESKQNMIRKLIGRLRSVQLSKSD